MADVPVPTQANRDAFKDTSVLRGELMGLKDEPPPCGCPYGYAESPGLVVKETFHVCGDRPQAEPHDFRRRGWRWWICDHCFAPRSLHPRREWVRARGYSEDYYLSRDAPHFKEGW